MKKYRLFSTVAIAIFLVALFPVSVSANSSWHWISLTNPLDIFPLVVIITLVSETLLIKKFAGTENTKISKLFCIITFANLLSFLIPYAVEFNTWIEEKWYDGYTFSEWVMKTPFYTTGVEFLIMTLLIEVPVVFLVLRKRTDNIKRLILVLTVTNVLSTIIVAIIERMLCYGSW